MKLRLLKTIDDFISLGKDDKIIVTWTDNAVKHNKGMNSTEFYHIHDNKKDYCEIICRKRGNHYFNYNRVIEGYSAAKTVHLITDEPEEDV